MILSSRNKVADFWDDYIENWILGESQLSQWFSSLNDEMQTLMNNWFKSYKGQGSGAIDLSCYPDPFYGDLRGEKYEPATVVLGLNPGIGYASLQSRQGYWTNKIRSESFSRCFDRIPLDSREWLTVHGKESQYWRCISNFAERINGHMVPRECILNMELYPWHSTRLTGQITVNPLVIERFLLAPLSELDARYVFAFGKPWWFTARNIGFKVMHLYGDSGMAMPGATCSGWHVAICRHELMHSNLVISWQNGNANPPGLPRIDTFKTILRVHS
jgi:hypothetical protein